MEEEPSREILKVEDLRVTLAPSRQSDRAKEVLRGVTFDVPPGTSVAVLGASGSGKSILCRAMTRFFHGLPIKETRGAVWFEGRNLLEEGQSRLFRLRGSRIAHLLQDAHEQFHPRITIAQHFNLLLRSKKKEVSDRTTHAMRYLYRVGVVDPDELLLGRVFPEELDAMMRQKIMIASLLACEPDLLVADEPTAEFDSRSVARIADVFDGLKRERGFSVLIATGRVRRAEQFGDVVAVLDDGVIAESASPRELFQESEQEATGAFMDGTLLAGKERERLVAHRKFRLDS